MSAMGAIGPVVIPSMVVIAGPLGQPATGAVQLHTGRADFLRASFVPGDVAFTVSQVSVTAPVFETWDEQELEGIHVDPKQRSGGAKGSYIPETSYYDGTSQVDLPKDADIVVSATFTASSVGVTRGTLTLTGGWGQIEVPAIAVVGTTGAPPTVSQEQVGLILRAGDGATPTVTITSPAPATVMATLTPGAAESAPDAIQITDVVVSAPERVQLTEDELQDLPPQLAQQLRKEGSIEWHETARTGPGTTVQVPGGGQVGVTLAITSPTSKPPDELAATLTIVSTSWAAIDVPVSAVLTDFSATPLTDRVSVKEGGSSDPFEVSLTSTYGADTDVQFAIAEPGSIGLDTPSVHYPRGASITPSLRVIVPPNPVLGNYSAYLGQSYNVGLKVTAFGGVYEHWFPLGVTLQPGSVTVAAQQGSITGLQGDTAVCNVSVSVGAGEKQMTFTAEGLPAGVQMAPLTQFVTGPTTQVVALQFTIGADAVPDQTEVMIAWNAGDDANSGAIQLPLVVQLRPESRTFSGQVVTPTGTAFGGKVEVDLSNSGAGTFSGGMRATGVPSYTFCARAVVRSADGSVVIAQQKSGEVYGTDTPGKSRELDWNEPFQSTMVASQWPSIRTASLAVSKSYEMSGLLGTLEDVATHFVEFLVAEAILPVAGGALAGVIFAGSELGALAGFRAIGPGGLAGVIAAAGVTCLLGPSILLPVLVGGVVTADALIKTRRLNVAEAALANSVFQGTVPLDRILLTNLTGLKGVEFTVPNVDDNILVNFGNGFDDAVAHTAPGRGYTEKGQILIHELTHAWQIANAGSTTDYFWRAALAKLAGNAAYRYGAPGPAFAQFGLEQQATIIEEWSVGTEGRALQVPIAGRDASPLQGMQETDPYYRYVANNIRMGLP